LRRSARAPSAEAAAEFDAFEAGALADGWLGTPIEPQPMSKFLTYMTRQHRPVLKSDNKLQPYHRKFLSKFNG
jgi:hypothetical protein